MDTLVWLVNFPATQGLPFAFIAIFSLPGLIQLSARHRTADTRFAIARKIQCWMYRIITIPVLIAGVIGLISLFAGEPITKSYILQHGISTVGSHEPGDASTVTFRAQDGHEYRIPVRPLTNPATAFSYGGPVEVRYLQDHPQAFVFIPITLEE